MSTPAEILEAAADYIDERGWCKGTFETTDGRVCVRRALTEVAIGSEGFDAIASFADAIGYPMAEIPVWNDADNRTREDVTRMLREVAASLTDAPDPRAARPWPVVA